MRNQGYNPHAMVTSTFLFLQGIGPTTERRFWQDGVIEWQHFLAEPKIKGLSAGRKAWYDGDLTLAQSHLDKRQLHWFTSRLPRREHWRFFDACRGRRVYLDIETTGAPPEHGDITVVGLHRNGHSSCLIQGETLTRERLQAEFDECDLLVTFFGSGFDIPYLSAKFPGLRFPAAHFDLCFAARRLGFTGGLKHIERKLGLRRDPALDHLDGWDAVRLWSQWRRGDPSALELLLAYNAADTENLIPLAAFLHEQLLTRFGPVSIYPPSGHRVLAKACMQ